MPLAWLRTYTASLCWAHLFKHFGTRALCKPSYTVISRTRCDRGLCWLQAPLSTWVLSDLLADSFERQRMQWKRPPWSEGFPAAPLINSVKLVIPLHLEKKTPNDTVTPQRQSQFTPKMKANAVQHLLSSLVWIDQNNGCNGMTSFMEFMCTVYLKMLHFI